MVINIITPCVPFWDVLSFLARSPSFQVLSIQAKTQEPHSPLASSPSTLPADHFLLYTK